MRLADLQTPALVVDRGDFEHNLTSMAAALPGARLRPHVKAHKSTALARRQAEAGHRGFTCATIREVERMAAAGLGEDLLLANEVVDTRRLGAVVEGGARVTLAVDSAETVVAAVAGGVREVVIDVNVGLPRCGCPPGDAGALAAAARDKGLAVRGVMGYEGHVVGLPDRATRVQKTNEAMELLLAAHADVGGELISAGGTGTYDINTWATEIQAGSYALMDTAYAELALPFRNVLTLLATVISVSPGWAVADCGLKALGMDHGNPSIPGRKLWFCSDEHVTFSSDDPPAVGDRVRILPGHVDPTVAYHETFNVVDGEEVVEQWPIDMRGLVIVIVALSLAACGGGDDGDGASSGGTQAIEASIRPNSERVIVATGTECHFDGDRQVIASGIVRNSGEKPYSVQISVRFLDADGVRIDLASDSISDLESGESARWDASVYSDDGEDVTRCEVSTVGH